jgi:integrase
MDLTKLRNWIWYPALEKAGLRRRTMYQSRHTYASLMLSAGENPQWVSRQLGHADLSVLISHYAKYIRNRERMDGRKFVQGFDEAVFSPVGALTQ